MERLYVIYDSLEYVKPKDAVRIYSCADLSGVTMPFLTVSSSKTMLEASLLSLVDSETVACCHDTILAPSLLLYIKLLCSRAHVGVFTALSVHCFVVRAL